MGVQAPPPASNPNEIKPMTPEEISAINAQTQALQNQAAAATANANAQNEAQKAGPQLQYNPLNDDGTMKSQFKIPDAGVYTDALKQQNQMNVNSGRDAASQQADAATQSAEQNLAMKGGLGANNQALLQMQGMKSGMANQQAVTNQGMQNDANIGVQGAAANLQIDKANVANQLTGAQNVNAFNLDKYNQNMAVNAANASANATQAAANSGKK